MKLAITVASIGTALALTGCHAFDNASTGTVQSRQHVVQHEEFDYMLCMAYGSNGGCVVSMPIYKTVPECWRIDFHNAKDDEYGSACVDTRDYAAYHMGDAYPRAR